MVDDLTAQLEQRRQDQMKNEANRAGNAASFAVFSSTGSGAFEFPDPIDFVVTFQEEPFLGYGSYINGDDLGEALGLDDDELPPYPMMCGFVTDWVQDSNGFYTGAYVGVRVTGGSDKVPVRHYFRFEGIGLKGLT